MLSFCNFMHDSEWRCGAAVHVQIRGNLRAKKEEVLGMVDEGIRTLFGGHPQCLEHVLTPGLTSPVSPSWIKFLRYFAIGCSPIFCAKAREHWTGASRVSG